MASGAFATLAGLVRARAVTLAFALCLFESKVDGCLAPGRWLYAMDESAPTVLHRLLADWALDLLGGPRWHSGVSARWEISWFLSGMAKAVKDMALRRARLWRLPTGDLYRDFFVRAARGPPCSWACKS